MNNKLTENNYIILPNFISKEKSSNLSFEFLNYCKENNLEGDSQAPNSHSAYNYIPFLELLCEKTPEISSAIGETVLPTYVYSRVYKNGSELLRHTDRDACEISVTLHLHGDSTWPIWIETPSGEKRSVELNPGDAMVYLGKVASHWRESYQGEYYTQVFLHYVRSRGECSYAYFDKVNEQNKPVTKTEEKIEEKIIEEPVTKEVILNSPEPSTNTVTYKSRKPLEDYIFALDNVVPEELCDRILEEYRDCTFWTPTSIGSGNIDNQIRNCDTINISQEVVIKKNFDIRKRIDEDFYVCASNAINEYRKLFPEVASEIDTGYDLLRYKKGQFYVQHTDSFKAQQRSVSCSFLLNDDYDGGEFAFFDREIMIRGPKGSIVMFPSNFMFPHEIMPVISGTRYSIITWYV
jgi:Rps23 Pro-64 3,4-dihydroxylase Tpa1-like proline 4-hydroxylase